VPAVFFIQTFSYIPLPVTTGSEITAKKIKSQKSFYHIQLIFKFNQATKTDSKLDQKETFKSISL